MNTFTFALFLLALLGLTTGYWLRDANAMGDDDDDSGNPLATLKKRTSMPKFMLEKEEDLCIPWRSPCTLDADLLEKYYFLQCCSGMSCKCTIWGNNCRCESRLG